MYTLNNTHVSTLHSSRPLNQAGHEAGHCFRSLHYLYWPFPIPLIAWFWPTRWTWRACSSPQPASKVQYSSSSRCCNCNWRGAGWCALCHALGARDAPASGAEK